jgi:ubiquinone/menaquinone biosynthesis C-methylase UbiE
MAHEETPASEMSADKAPGHWVLARLGKRVLRPGGIELTRQMISGLQIQAVDHVVEFAPGLGPTARLALQHHPASYTGIEQNEKAAAIVRKALSGEAQRCVVGEAEDTGLPDASATVLYGEAMLTMQAMERKRRIVREAFRVLQPGGRYGIHEVSLVPDDVPDALKEDIGRQLSRTIRQHVRPLTVSEWSDVLREAGFDIHSHATAGMHLLEPRRIISDEGLLGTMRFAANLARDGEARRRVLSMRNVFRQFREHLAAITLVAHKPEGSKQ